MREIKEVLSDMNFNEVNFGDGVKIPEGILSVRWPGGVCLRLDYTWAYHLIIEHEGSILKHQILRKNENNQVLLWVKRWTKDICDGKYKSKKTTGEKIHDIIVARNLTSQMNNTKWKEFRTAMLEEMPFEPPYDYKTLFDESDYILKDYIQYFLKSEGPYSFASFDSESFNFLCYKSLEWVKVRPRFFSEDGGQLVKRQIWYDSEKEFVEILEKYNIPYEIENGVYTIFGYK